MFEIMFSLYVYIHVQFTHTVVDTYVHGATHNQNPFMPPPPHLRGEPMVRDKFGKQHKGTFMQRPEVFGAMEAMEASPCGGPDGV